MSSVLLSVASNGESGARTAASFLIFCNMFSHLSCRLTPGVLCVPRFLFALAFISFSGDAQAQLSISQIGETILDRDGLVLPSSGRFSTTINGSPFQQEALLTHKGYQYTTWYNNGSDNQNIFVGRRRLGASSWESIDTGHNLENGDASASSAGRRWDSHNVISLGISGDGKIHLAYDHHVDRLRYLTTNAGVATASGGQWNQAIFNNQRSSLNVGGTSIPRVTYPRFTSVGEDLVLTYRDFGSGSGDVLLSEYSSQNGQWSDIRIVNRGRNTGQVYDDVNNNPSNQRNAYHNGFHADETGRLHTTWTWREGTQDGNRDLHYAYSDNRGLTWRNSAGDTIGSQRFPISSNSPGTAIVELDRQQSILNQQGQVVDKNGGVHALVFHRRQEPGFEWEPGDGTFSHREDSAYHHYYRDPFTGQWSVSLLEGQTVGSRPRLGVDSNGNVFGIYTERQDLVITAAEFSPAGFSDWEVVYRDGTRNYEGTPQIDLNRLLQDDILSVYVQQRVESVQVEDPTSGILRVIEFQVNSTVAVPEPGSLALLALGTAIGLHRRRRPA